MCKISIIVPIYNVEKYLRECMDSLINQTLKDIEIICVNDSSPDHSIDICKEYQKNDQRIVIVDKQINEGLGYARNSGISVAKGRFIAFCDSDDCVNLDMYETLYNYATSNDLDACFCNYLRFDQNGNIDYSKESDKELLFKGKSSVYQLMLDMIGPSPDYRSDVKFNFCSWRAIYSRDIIINYNILFPSEREVASEDLPFNVDFLMNANSVAYIPYIGYRYRFNPNSLSKTFTLNKYYCLLNLIDCVRRQLINSSIPFEVFHIHFYRNVLYTFRTIIKYMSIVPFDSSRFKGISLACNDKRLREVFNSKYPLNQLPLKHFFFSLCMKFKIVPFLYFASVLENIKNKTL